MTSTETLTIHPIQGEVVSSSRISDQIKRPAPSAHSFSLNGERDFRWSNDGKTIGNSNLDGGDNVGHDFEPLDLDESHRNDENVILAKESWRSPRINTARIAYVFFAFFNLGIQDGALGPLIPALESYYGLDYTTVSLIFLASFPGYLLAAISSDRLHMLVGPRGVAIFASTLRIAAYVTLACHPPWAVDIVLLIFGGWGNGLIDAAWNAWVGGLDRPNELLGLIHAAYGLGAAVAPLIASALVDRANKPWYVYYYLPLSLACAELIFGAGAFWSENRAEFLRKNTASLGSNTTESGTPAGRTRAALRSRTTWLIALFLLFYVGAEVALSGWVVTFMIRVRNAQPFDASLTSTGFWLGVTMGRLVLGFVTPQIGERWAIVAYLAVAMGLELIFWLVPQFIVSAVAVALLGFVLGPMFPAAIVALSKLLPKHLHVGAVSFAAAVGMGGGAVLPFVVGAIASAAGVWALQPIVLALLLLLLGLWLVLPAMPRDKRSD